ncbi:MAG: ELMO/CED-12 family-domain-containing protein, partial [Olpidium bornovanus]
LEDDPGSVDAVFLSVLRKKSFPLGGDPTRSDVVLRSNIPFDLAPTVAFGSAHHPDNFALLSPAAIELRRCLNRISESYKLLNELNARAKTTYSNSNAAHEKKLLQLWNLLMPRDPLPERFTNSWQKIGFQGKDPATDFRGMEPGARRRGSDTPFPDTSPASSGRSGMLGLDDLHYFASNYPVECGEVLRSSRHEVSWYSFAIVGINITAWTINMLRARKLQYHLYRYGPTKNFHHELYCEPGRRPVPLPPPFLAPGRHPELYRVDVAATHCSRTGRSRAGAAVFWGEKGYVFVNFNKHWSSKVPDVTVMGERIAHWGAKIG